MVSVSLWYPGEGVRTHGCLCIACAVLAGMGLEGDLMHQLTVLFQSVVTSLRLSGVDVGRWLPQPFGDPADAESLTDCVAFGRYKRGRFGFDVHIVVSPPSPAGVHMVYIYGDLIPISLPPHVVCDIMAATSRSTVFHSLPRIELGKKRGGMRACVSCPLVCSISHS